VGLYHVIPAQPDPELLKAGREAEVVWLGELPAHVARLKELFAGHDAFDVLASILQALSANEALPVAARDPFLDSVAAAEYAALVLVERPSRAPASSAPLLDLGATIKEAVPHLRALTFPFAATALSRRWHRPPDDALAAIQERFVVRYIFVPINETDQQASTWLLASFEDPVIERWMRAELGFGVEQGNSLITAIMQETASSVLRSTSSVIGIGEHVAFSPANIASRAGVQERVAWAFCDLLAMRFGEPLRGWPTLPTAIRHRPLLADGVGRYFAPIPAMVRRGLRYTLAAALNPALPKVGPGHRSTYQRYLDRRASLLESRSLVPLRQLLQPDYAVGNLHFKLRASNGKHLEGEIDGLVTIDRKAIVVQAKSAPTRIDAVATDADRFASALRAIVTESMRQHDDARAALLAPRDSVTFWLRQGERRVTVDPPDLAAAEILPITVTLDDLAGCAAASWELRDAGLATDGVLPWVVAASTLESILSLLTFPAQLVQFLRRRSDLNEARNLEFADEIDVFLEYLHDHLEFVYTVGRSGNDQVRWMPPERFPELDAWLEAKNTGDKRVKPPRQKLHRGIRALLGRLDQDRPAGWLDVSVAVLDVPRRFHQRVGAIAIQALSSTRGEMWARGPTYRSMMGELRLCMFISEPEHGRVNNSRMLDWCVTRARSAGASTLTAVVVPQNRSAPLRVLSAEEPVSCPTPSPPRSPPSQPE
jgi:hypothetical protein